jgi:hypothetical protein
MAAVSINTGMQVGVVGFKEIDRKIDTPEPGPGFGCCPTSPVLDAPPERLSFDYFDQPSGC